jgi:hypothetical protein
MTSELTSQLTVGLMILWLSTVVAMALILSLLLVGYVKRSRLANSIETKGDTDFRTSTQYLSSVFDTACRWIAVKSTNLEAVQSALHLHNPTPCSWGEGVSRLTQHNLFISPPVQGWILVVGQGLPDPTDDVDECYKLIGKLSRELGQLQFFSVNRVVNHHAWVRAENGRITRGYAWDGRTLWNQGKLTAAERELGMKCFDYWEDPEYVEAGSGESHHANADKVSFLAARWSIDPTSIDESMLSMGQGIAGYLHHSRSGG